MQVKKYDFSVEMTVDSIGNLFLWPQTFVHAVVALYGRCPAQVATLADSSFRLVLTDKHPFMSFDPKNSFLYHLLSTNRLTNN